MPEEAHDELTLAGQYAAAGRKNGRSEVDVRLLTPAELLDVRAGKFDAIGQWLRREVLELALRKRRSDVDY